VYLREFGNFFFVKFAVCDGNHDTN
jgi:hypothetical protein